MLPEVPWAGVCVAEEMERAWEAVAAVAVFAGVMVVDGGQGAVARVAGVAAVAGIGGGVAVVREKVTGGRGDVGCEEAVDWAVAAVAAVAVFAGIGVCGDAGMVRQLGGMGEWARTGVCGEVTMVVTGAGADLGRS
jgi:hypothetical protein